MTHTHIHKQKDSHTHTHSLAIISKNHPKIKILWNFGDIFLKEGISGGNLAIF